MDIEKLASLISVRRYAADARQFVGLFTGSDYKKINTKIQEMDELLKDLILSLDLDDLLKEEYLNIAYTHQAPTMPEGPTVGKAQLETGVFDSQLPLPLDDPNTFENKKVKTRAVATKKTSKKDFGDDEDSALITKRIAEEKAKIAKRKSVSK